ncbi:MAG: NosD domain-containing protein, partial [Pirellulaceae bacterium]
MSRRQRRSSRPLRFEGLECRLALATFYVAADGDDANVGTAASPWRTLQMGADTVQAGDTVNVRAGSYTGFDLRTDGTAAQPIVFQAEPNVVINARNARTPDGINLEGADYVTIDGFQVVGMPRAGIRSVLNEHVTIRNNRTDQNYVWGIFTGFSDDLLIEGNVASRSATQHGIYVSNSGDRPVIRNNVSWGNDDCGIHMNGDINMGGD